MPENTGAAGDGGQGGEGAPNGGAGAGAGAPNSGTEPPKELKFTQDQLDAIIKDRVARAVPADYEELKRKATEYDTAQAAGKTDLEKAQAAQAKAEKERDEALAKANATLIRAEIIGQATAQNAVDPDTVAALLAGAPSVTIADGQVAGAKEAVKALLKEKPFLVKGTQSGGGASAGEFGGNDPATLDQKIAELERAGKYGEARELKMQKMAGLAASE